MVEPVESVAVRVLVAYRREPIGSVMRSVRACRHIDGALNFMAGIDAVMPRIVSHAFSRLQAS